MVIWILIAITVGVSLLCFLSRSLLLRLALSPYQVVHYRQFYRLVTHMLVHGDWLHLLFNMLVFYSFADVVLAWMAHYGGCFALSNFHLLSLYVGGGITAAILGLRSRKDDPSSLVVGASAGVSAVVFASILFSPWDMIYLFAFVPLPGFILGALYLLYSWYMAKRGGGNVDHMAHFYGALFGLLYPLLVEPRLFVHFTQALFTPL